MAQEDEHPETFQRGDSVTAAERSSFSIWRTSSWRTAALDSIQAAYDLWNVDSSAFGRKAKTIGEARLQLLLGIILLVIALILMVTILLEGPGDNQPTSKGLFQVSDLNKD